MNAKQTLGIDNEIDRLTELWKDGWMNGQTKRMIQIKQTNDRQTYTEMDRRVYIVQKYAVIISFHIL